MRLLAPRSLRSPPALRALALAAALLPVTAGAGRAQLPLPQLPLPLPTLANPLPVPLPGTVPGALTCPQRTASLASPFLGLWVNGACADLTTVATVVRSTTGVVVWTAQGNVVTATSRIQFTATFDGDPYIDLDVSTTNLVGGPLTYGFTFGTPIVPGFYNFATSSAASTITPGGPGAASFTTSPLYPTYVSGYGTLGATATNLGVDLGTAPCVAGALASMTCDYGMRSNSFAPTFFDNLEALLTYDQTGLESTATWRGRVELTAGATQVVPEPATVTLLAVGLLGTLLVGARRGSRRRSATTH